MGLVLRAAIVSNYKASTDCSGYKQGLSEPATRVSAKWPSSNGLFVNLVGADIQVDSRCKPIGRQ